MSAAFVDLREQPETPNGLLVLASRLARGRPDVAHALTLAMKLCTALGDLHRRGIVHNAVNPSHVLVDETYATGVLAESPLAARGPVDPRATAAAVLALGAARYMSPEQTGRINRSIDHRSDLYSLGATLYELLTGRAPFDTRDPLELIHSHVAKPPVPPALVFADIPEQLSRLVVRLLAKAAEDRYQTAAGVRHDLERCEAEWSSARSISLFPLGERDISDRLLIPERLYGRDAELEALTMAFDAARDGEKGLLLVSGYSGVGKTSFISELSRPIARQRGYFVTGKFDQVARNIPYGALIQAFRALIGLVLAESEEQLARIRQRLSKELGANGGVIAEVIPEIEFVIGKQAPPKPLDPTETQNRFRYVLGNFVGTFAQAAHPLVLFLDDLQWADSATIALLHALLTGPDQRHLLIIGAYRDNEVDAEHPLTAAVERLEASGAAVRRVALGSLARPHLLAFLADTLRTDEADVETLALLIQQKTDGNPFFVIQFLRALYQDGLIVFDHDASRWSYRTEAIAAAGITDNVISLLTRRIQRLSPRAQDVLKLAACIGSPFEWRTFVTASRRMPDEDAAGLAEALEAGLVEPAAAQYEPFDTDSAGDGASYEFLHDRVQQAAYALIPESERKGAHLDVGRLLLAECGDEVPEGRLFQILNHLNVGGALLTESERIPLVRLNLAAGRKAKASTAYDAAWGYLRAATGLLTEADVDADYLLWFAAHLEAAECQYLAGHFTDAERAFDALLGGAKSSLDKASVHSLRAIMAENQSRYAEAVSAGREGLALFQISFPESPEDASRAIDREMQSIKELLGDRSIDRLVELPVMNDEAMRMVMRILTSIWAPAYITGNELLARLISATMVRLSLAYGNTEDSAYGYVTHAITVGPIKRDFRASYEWGELALKVNERFGDTKRRAKIHQQIHAHVKLWSRPFEACIPHAREARKSGLEAGDFAYAGYGAATESWPAFLSNRDLSRFVEDHTPALELLGKINMEGFRDTLRLMLSWARALTGRTVSRVSLSGPDFEEDDYVARYASAAPLLLTFLHTARLHLAVIMEEHELGVAAAAKASEITVSGTIWPVLAEFWGSLALAAGYAAARTEERVAFRARVESALAAMEELAESCPENYRCFALLLSAELSRMCDKLPEAVAQCEEAMSYARLTDNLQQQALATELCARCLLLQGNPTLARGFLGEAYRCYAAWGATAKLRQMEEKYGLSRERTEGRDSPSDPPQAFPPAGASVMDVASVVKGAQAIAAEVELDGLLGKLMKIALENAGAERGVFISDAEGGAPLVVEAVVGTDALRRDGTGSDDPLFQSVVRYVRRTEQDIVLDDALEDERFAADALGSPTSARSVMCVPVSQQGRLGGILYLENRLSHVFSPERTEVVRALSAQAAISLVNARLYDEMKREVVRRTSAEQELRRALEQVEEMKSRLEAENVYLQEEIGTVHNFNEIVGMSAPLVAALRKVELVAPTDSTVLVLGETGSGKELFARAIHSRSARRERALVKVNCGAISPGLVESELFGHVKGAFTGAVEKRIGRFELANGGTIFLDEIGELPPDAQVKLLRVLQEHEFEPVGSSRTLRVDVRVIAATNRNLEEAVRQGRFRADLLYRLNVVPIEVPPLRERRADIGLLTDFFLANVARKLGKSIEGFTARSRDAMMRYPWPGNVRELENVVERAVILATGPVIELRPGMLERPVSPAGASAGSARDDSSMDDIQRSHIQSVLRRTGGIVEGPNGAATILGMHPNTLRSRMKKLGLTSGAARSRA
jgi:predicted ATPase/transcriptional regulator with GAF, ATPase, and Fis domain